MSLFTFILLYSSIPPVIHDSRLFLCTMNGEEIFRCPDIKLHMRQQRAETRDTANKRQCNYKDMDVMGHGS